MKSDFDFSHLLIGCGLAIDFYELSWLASLQAALLALEDWGKASQNCEHTKPDFFVESTSTRQQPQLQMTLKTQCGTMVFVF